METGMLSMLLQSMLGLAFVLGLFALLVWGARRLNLHNGGIIQRDFKIIQRMHIDNKHSVVEIRHKDHHYLLGLSPGGMVQLYQKDRLYQKHGLHQNHKPDQTDNLKKKDDHA